VKNVCAAGTFELETKGHTVELIDPVVEHDPSASWAPVGVRQVLIGIAAEYYLQARTA
jgi:hypothetical protein